MKFLVTKEKIYTREIEAESEQEANEKAQEIVWSEDDVVDDETTVEM